MTYDNTDTNADGTLDAEVDNSLIDTANGELKGDVDAKNNDVNNVGAIEVANMTNVKMVSEYSGSTLAEKVENAHADTPENAKMVVTPKSDGSRWSWGKDVFVSTGEFDLRIGDSVEIEYPGDGVALTISRDVNNTAISETTFRFIGGNWYSTGNDPDGLVKTQDIFGAVIKPHEVQDFYNQSTDAFGIRAENVESWTEMCTFGGYIDADTPIDFAPASVTGGSGTESYKGTIIEDFECHPKNAGIHFRGHFSNSEFRRPNVWFGGDNAVGFLLDANFKRGCVFVAPSVEDPGADTYTGGVGFKTGSNYQGEPLLQKPHVTGDVDTVFETESDDHFVQLDDSTFEARAYTSSTQSVDDKTETIIQFDTETYNPRGNFNTSTGKYETVYPARYEVIAYANWVDSFSEGTSSSLRVFDGDGQYAKSDADGGTENQIKDVIPLKAREGLEIKAWQNSGGSVTLADGENRTRVVVKPA